MKLNAKDIAAGVFLILVAIAGLWLNQEHAIGTARRMGSGYMPMLVFGVLASLGALVVALAFFGGPDPLQKWTKVEATSFIVAIGAGLATYAVIAPLLGPTFTQNYSDVGLGALVGFIVLCWGAGWRRLGFILAAMCVFGLLLIMGGLVVAIIGTIAVSALADPDHVARPRGVLGLMVFLIVLCWWVFIYQLDIRVPLWPWSY